MWSKDETVTGKPLICNAITHPLFPSKLHQSKKLPNPRLTGFGLHQLPLIHGNPAFPGTAHVGVRRFGEIPTHLAHLFADVLLFRTSVSADFGLGHCALCLYHISP